MRFIVLLLAWILSLLALAAAGLAAMTALKGQLPLWIGVGAGVVFALIANPMTSGMLGFKGRPIRTLVAYIVLVGVGVGSLYMNFKYLQSPEYLRTQGRLPQLVRQYDYSTADGVTHRRLWYAASDDVLEMPAGVRSIQYVEYSIMGGGSVDAAGKLTAYPWTVEIDCEGRRERLVSAGAFVPGAPSDFTAADGEALYLLEFACADPAARKAGAESGRWPYASAIDPSEDATRLLCAQPAPAGWLDEAKAAYRRLCPAS